MRFLILVLSLAACSSNKSGSSDGGSTNPLIAARPYDSFAPSTYVPQTAMPLVVSLHGYGETAFLQDSVFGLSAYAETAGFLVAMPQGLSDSMHHPFWNATDACCDLDHTGVDDVAYLNAVVDDMQAHYNVDPKRIFFVGHSNGGFMSHRMACDASSRIAAIVSLAGAQWKDVSKCKPSAPVAVLQVHGDADTEVPYGGAADLPSAMETVGDWATLDGCAGAVADTGETLDLDTALVGPETHVARASCTAGAAELWTIHGGSHVPSFALPGWPQHFYAFLMAHPKP
ncbi:MAG TPA: alpha/beta fold hydrolase [Polyangia bacterium]|nr:alpha/beta fold hydrolase [Polyangia bacterium]